MKVVHCINCGTPNLIDENSVRIPKCIKCGQPVQASGMLIEAMVELLPPKVLWSIIGVIVLLFVLLFIFLINGGF